MEVTFAGPHFHLEAGEAARCELDRRHAAPEHSAVEDHSGVGAALVLPDEVGDRVSVRDPVRDVVELRRVHAESLTVGYLRRSTARCSCCLLIRERPEIPIRFASL